MCRANFREIKLVFINTKLDMPHIQLHIYDNPHVDCYLEAINVNMYVETNFCYCTIVHDWNISPKSRGRFHGKWHAWLWFSIFPWLPKDDDISYLHDTPTYWKKKSGFEISRYGSAKFVIPLKFTIFIIRFCIRKLKTPFLKGLFDIFINVKSNDWKPHKWDYIYLCSYEYLYDVINREMTPIHKKKNVELPQT